MKPKSTHRSFLALAGSSLLAISSASAQTTYTWTQKTTGEQSWNTEGNWLGGTASDIFVSGSANELRFFEDTTASNQLATGADIVVTDVPPTLSLNTLTLNGKGPNVDNSSSITIGTSASTWTLGDGTTSTVNLNSAITNTVVRNILYTVAANLELTGGTGGITTFTGDSLSSRGAIFSGNITQTTAGQGITKSGASVLTLSGDLSYTGVTTVNAGKLRITSASTLTSGYVINGGVLGDDTNSALAMTTATLNDKDITVNGVGTLGVISSTTSGALTLNDDLSLWTQGTANFDGAVTGAGKLSVGYISQSNTALNLNSSGNTFTGGVDYSRTGNGNVTLNVNSFVDTATLGEGNIRFGIASNGGIHTFALGSGYNTGGLTLDNRQFEMVGNTTGRISNNSVEQFTINTDLLVSATGTRTLQFGGTGSGTSTFAGDIGNGALDTLNLTKVDGNSWILSGSNTYTGSTTIGAGTLSISSIGKVNGSASSLGMPDSEANGRILIGAGNTTGTLLYTGSGETTDRTIQINSSANTNAGGAVITNDGTGALTFTAATFNNDYTNANSVNRVLTLGGSNGGEIEGVIQNNSATNTVGLTKSGTGTWSLSGTNTYTGSAAATGGTILNAGKLILDYFTNDTNKIAGVLTLNGGTLELSGSAGNYTQAVTSTTINNGGSFITQPTGGAKLAMGAITFTGGALDFAEESIATTTTVNHASGGLASAAGVYRLTVGGADWAKNDESGNIVAFAAEDYTAFDGTTSAANINYSINGDVSLSGGNRGAATNTFKIITSGAGQTLDLNTGQLSLGSLLFTGDNSYEITNTTGRINTSFILHNYGSDGATLTLAATNGVITQFGTGKTILTGNNAANVGININGGTVQINDNLQIGNNNGVAVITLNNGTLLASDTLALDADGAGLRARTITLGAGGGTLAAADTKTLTVSGVISGAGNSLTIGSVGNTGTVALTGINTYTGNTNVNDGTLLVNGSLSGTNTVTVYAGATLGGTGTLGGNTVIANGGMLEFDLSTAPGSHDKLEIAAGKTLTFSGSSSLTLTSSGGATTGTYTLLTAAGGIIGDAVATVNLPSGWTADAPQIVGNDLQINITSTGGGAGSAYDTWKAANAPGSNPDDDTDGDGVSNAVEFVLGGTSVTNDLDKLPVAAADGTNMTFTFVRDQASIDPKTDLFIETSSDLLTWDSAPSPYTVPDAAVANNPGVTVVKDSPGSGKDTVTLTLPQDSAKKFARLKVVITP